MSSSTASREHGARPDGRGLRLFGQEAAWFFPALADTIYMNTASVAPGCQPAVEALKAAAEPRVDDQAKPPYVGGAIAHTPIGP
jgi:hypothetical protein